MIYLLLFVIVLAILLLPQLWIKRVMSRYGDERDDIKGTGAEFARHLLQHLDMAVKVEQTDAGDHYDPESVCVRLSADHYDKRSLAAMVVAAHEVGHAIQHHRQEVLFQRRIGLAKLAFVVQKVAPIALTISPIFLALTKSPLLSVLTLMLGVAAVGLGTLVHLVTLPVEWDASFNKAMPLLEQGQYFTREQDYAAARELLKAAAFTYVAASLYNLLNLAYWLRLLRR